MLVSNARSCICSLVYLASEAMASFTEDVESLPDAGSSQVRFESVLACLTIRRVSFQSLYSYPVALSRPSGFLAAA